MSYRLNAAQRLAIVDELRRRGPGRWCAYCKRGVNRADATLDHVIPRARGGETKIGNLVVACSTCNKIKRDHILGEVTEPHSCWYPRGREAGCLLCSRPPRRRRQRAEDQAAPQYV